MIDRHAEVRPEAVLPAAGGRRLSNQIGRAFRGTFGAKTGLRTIVRSVAAQMLAAGATPESVERALETCVLDHPARLGCGSDSLLTGKLHSMALVALACECVGDVARPDGGVVSSSGTRTRRSATPRSRGNTTRQTRAQVVLIVEPDESSRAALRLLLESDGYTVVATSGADDAVAIIDSTRIGLVVTEMYITGRVARCLLPMIAGSASRRRARVLVYTRHGQTTDREWAAANGASGYVLKRSGATRLLAVVERLAGRDGGRDVT
jgi:CheY-like chemotaxis protein